MLAQSLVRRADCTVHRAPCTGERPAASGPVVQRCSDPATRQERCSISSLLVPSCPRLPLVAPSPSSHPHVGDTLNGVRLNTHADRRTAASSRQGQPGFFSVAWVPPAMCAIPHSGGSARTCEERVESPKPAGCLGPGLPGSLGLWVSLPGRACNLSGLCSNLHVLGTMYSVPGPVGWPARYRVFVPPLFPPRAFPSSFWSPSEPSFSFPSHQQTHVSVTSVRPSLESSHLFVFVFTKPLSLIAHRPRPRPRSRPRPRPSASSLVRGPQPTSQAAGGSGRSRPNLPSSSPLRIRKRVLEHKQVFSYRPKGSREEEKKVEALNGSQSSPSRSTYQYLGSSPGSTGPGKLRPSCLPLFWCLDCDLDFCTSRTPKAVAATVAVAAHPRYPLSPSATIATTARCYTTPVSLLLSALDARKKASPADPS